MMFGGPHLLIIVLAYAMAALLLGAVIYFSVLFALKSHTRWIDRGKPGAGDPPRGS